VITGTTPASLKKTQVTTERIKKQTKKLAKWNASTERTTQHYRPVILKTRVRSDKTLATNVDRKQACEF